MAGSRYNTQASPGTESNPFLISQHNETFDAIDELRSRYNLIRQAEPVAGGGGSGSISTGVVSSATAATSDVDGNDMTPGAVSVWEYLAASQLDRYDSATLYPDGKPVLFRGDPHDIATTYDQGDLVELNAPDHDDTATYSEDDLVAHIDRVWRANANVTTGAFAFSEWTLVAEPGTYSANANNTSGDFVSGDWTEVTVLGDPGEVKFANGTVPAGTFNANQWTDATGTLFIDRTQTPLELVNEFEGDPPPVGALVKWSGTKLIGPTCDKQSGWI